MIEFDAAVQAVDDDPLTLPMPDYLPPPATGAGHRIALIGCGGISALHLAAYRQAGLPVAVLCDHSLDRAIGRRDAYFPGAAVTTSVTDVLADPDIDVVDIATHVEGRADLVAAALRAGKNVLSQKPFVTDLAEADDLIALAEAQGCTLAVNHNGRWAPQFAAALASVRRGDIGRITSADFSVYWPHDRVVGEDPRFATMTDLILFDFGIHWFDLIAQLFAGAGRPVRVYASTFARPGARVAVATDADVTIEFEHAHASILFRGSAARAESGGYRIEGTDGTIRHSGLSLSGDTVCFDTARGSRILDLQGDWWTNGMFGTMAELLTALDEKRPASNDAHSSLGGLSLCFAAMHSVREHRPVDPADAQTAPVP